MTKLGDICTINMGQSPSSSSYNSTGEGLPFFQGNADFGDIHPTVRTWCSNPIKIAEKGDLLISVRAPIGALNIANEQCCIGRGLAALTNYKKNIYKDYLWFALYAKIDELNSKGTGSTFKAINKKILSETDILLPSLEKQKQISKQLKCLDTLLSKRRQQLSKLDQLVKSRFIEMFGVYSETAKLSDVAMVTGGITKNTKRDNLPLRIPYLRVANVAFASIDVSEMLDIGLTEEEYVKTLLHNGDLLFVEGNGSPEQIGRVAIWRNEIVPCVHQNHLIKARFYKNIAIPIFIMYYFMSLRGREQIKNKAISTSGLYTLSVSKVSDLKIPLPPVKLQEQFAAFVQQVEKTKSSVKQSLEKLETLKKSLMQEYFG